MKGTEEKDEGKRKKDWWTGRQTGWAVRKERYRRCFWWVFDSLELQWQSKGPSLHGEVLCYKAQGVISLLPLIYRQEQPLPRHIRHIYTFTDTQVSVFNPEWEMDRANSFGSETPQVNLNCGVCIAAVYLFYTFLSQHPMILSKKVARFESERYQSIRTVFAQSLNIFLLICFCFCFFCHRMTLYLQR